MLNNFISSKVVFLIVLITLLGTKIKAKENPIAQKMAISRFCHVLDTLDRTGVPILDALEIAGKTAGNAFIEASASCKVL